MPNVAGKRVVIFGDSLSEGAGSPGAALGAQLGKAGATVLINARIGRSANNFYGREDVAGQLASIAAFHPDIAIVELGTNDLGLNLTVDGQRMSAIRDALAGPRKIPVYGFGPPAFPDASSNAQAIDVVNMMRAAFGSRFLDLRSITSDILSTATGRAGDGVHFTSVGGAVVGGRMAQTFLAADSGNAASLIVAFGIGVLAWLAFR